MNIFACRLLLLLTIGHLAASPFAARAQNTGTVTTFFTFQPGSPGSPDIKEPSGKLIPDAVGNFYGVAVSNTTGLGVIYRASAAGQVTVVHSFQSADGIAPNSLFLGHDGNLYGIAAYGGYSQAGTIFQLTPAGRFTVLHQFNPSLDGTMPNSLVQDADGNLYGTTLLGPKSGYGVLYEISATGQETVLHTFTGSGDGYGPNNLILGSDGNLYGTTTGNYIENSDRASLTTLTPATLFRYAQGGTFTTICTFPADNSELGPNSLVQGSDGNFYGTTAGIFYSQVIPNVYGTVFQVTPAGERTVLHRFTGFDGLNPLGLTQTGEGSFYGNTSGGGAQFSDTSGDGFGTAFQIAPTGRFTSLYDFTFVPNGDYFINPTGPLLKNSDGSFFGTVSGTNSTFSGSVYRLTPAAHPAFFAGQAPLGSGVYYLSFAKTNFFGYYAFLSDPNYLYHFDLGYEYLVEANDSVRGLYLYDFASNGFFYTSPSFPFPYLYDFSLNTVLYYYPDPGNLGHYNPNGARYFYNFATGQIIVK